MTELTSSGGRVRWLLIGWIFVIAAIAFLDRVNISIAGKYIQQEFHLDNVQLGWIFSAFVAGYALFQAPGGRLADRFGPRRVLAIGALCGATFTSLTALVPSTIVGALAVMIAVRVGLGIGEAVIFPGSNRLVASWIPSKERGLANGLIFAGVGAGAGLTPPLITYIMQNWGWRASFFMTAPIEVAAGVIWYLLARDKPEAHPWVGKGELANDSGRLAQAGGIAEGDSAAGHSGEPGPPGALGQLFLLRIRGLHLLHLVLPVPEQCPRAQPEIERVLRDVAVSRHGDMFAPGGLDQRPDDEAIRQAGRPRRHRHLRIGDDGRIPLPGNAGGRCAAGQHRSGGRRRRPISLAEFVLVGYGGSGRPLGWDRLGPDEHVQPGREAY